MGKYVVLIDALPFCASSRAALDRLPGGDFEIIDMRAKGVDDPEFMEALRRADILIHGINMNVTSDLLAGLPRLKLIANYGVGLDAIDLAACTEKGVVVCNTPGCNTQAVADQTFGMLLALLNYIPEGDSAIRHGVYDQKRMIGREIWKKTIGIVGLGGIGRAVAERARGFRMNIIGFDPYWPDGFAGEYGIRRAGTIEEMLPELDVLTLHCSLTDENRHMINRHTLGMMKAAAVIVNTGRGELIDENDLFEALKTGVISGAAIDAWTNEPPAGSPLLSLKNVLAMPHCAGLSQEALHNVDMMVVEQILTYSRGGQPQPTVNNVTL